MLYLQTDLKGNFWTKAFSQDILVQPVKRLWHFDSSYTKPMHLCQQYLDTKLTLANGSCLGLFLIIIFRFFYIFTFLRIQFLYIFFNQLYPSSTFFFYPVLKVSNVICFKGFPLRVVFFFFWSFLLPELCPGLEHSSKHFLERFILCSLILKFFWKIRHTAVLTKLFL